MLSSSLSLVRKRKKSDDDWNDVDERENNKNNKNDSNKSNGSEKLPVVDQIKKRNKRQRRKEHCEKLIRDAHSHGPYLWKTRDLQNALKWFVIPTHNNTSTNTSSQSELKKDDAKEQSIMEVLWEQRTRFLYTLLCSRGTLIHRPLKMKKMLTLHQNNEPKDDDGKLFTKQKPLLQSVLTALTKTNKITTTTQEQPNNDETTDRVHQTCLQRVVTSRTITRELYSLALILSSVAYSSSASMSNKNHLPHESNQRRKRLACYFTNPKTTVFQTYASQLFHRLYELQISAVEKEQKNIKNQQQYSMTLIASTVSPGVHLLLEKLIKLAVNNPRIQETIFLLLLSFDEYACQNNTTSNKHLPTKRKEILDIIHPKLISSVLELIKQTNSKMMKNTTSKSILLENILGVFVMPSPLLCSLSQFHQTTIAKSYVKQMIQACIHIKVFLVKSISDVIIQQHCTDFDTANGSSSKFHGWYQDIIMRLVEICQTCHSLQDLVIELFHTYPQWSKTNQKTTSYEDMESVITHQCEHNDNKFILSMQDDLLRLVNKP